jgi:hypothetical protein
MVRRLACRDLLIAAAAFGPVIRRFEAAAWMREKGVRFQLGLGRQAFRVGGKFKFWAGSPAISGSAARS